MSDNRWTCGHCGEGSGAQGHLVSESAARANGQRLCEVSNGLGYACRPGHTCNPPQVRRDRFHHHLDQCERCRTRPMDLCLTGAQLLHATVAAGHSSIDAPDVAAPAAPNVCDQCGEPAGRCGHTFTIQPSVPWPRTPRPSSDRPPDPAPPVVERKADV